MSHPDHEKNRIAWNGMAEVHYKHPDYKVKEFLEGWNSLHSIEQEDIGDVTGKSLLHLQCHFGLDTLSWARKGATVTGVDISETAIKYANELKVQARFKNTKFVLSDVLELVGKIDEKFDVVFQSYGTHMWIHDFYKLAEVIAHHLKPGGMYYIIDTHPIMTLYATENYSYLHTEAERYVNEQDYCDPNYIIKEERVEWQHPISLMVNALIKAGLVIDLMNEYDKTFDPLDKDWIKTGDYYYPPDGPPRYPMMLSIRAKKPK